MASISEFATSLAPGHVAIRNKKTAITKQERKVKGGVILNDETVKPYMEELAKLEAKMAKDKQKMSTGERVDNAAEQVMAAGQTNTEDIVAHKNVKFERVCAVLLASKNGTHFS